MSCLGQGTHFANKFSVGAIWKATEFCCGAPMKAVPGAKMRFVGSAEEKDRRNIIAYSTTLT
jgi:cytochrome c2